MVTLRTKLNFGKYQGETVGSVISKDPKYVEWCSDSIDGFDLSSNALTRLLSALSEREESSGMGEYWECYDYN